MKKTIDKIMIHLMKFLGLLSLGFINKILMFFAIALFTSPLEKELFIDPDILINISIVNFMLIGYLAIEFGKSIKKDF